MPERNISAFNSDTSCHGGYVYTSVDRLSSRVSTGRQTDELLRMLTEHFPRSTKIVDLGCGDGTFTMEIARQFQPASIRGIDPAALAIEAARRATPSELAETLHFEVGNIYKTEAKPGESLAIVRGVLHHLDEPQAAIAQLGRQFPAVLALEPNGYNPVMKIIEKVSTYHREHDEKSYWPPTLNGWFEGNGFSMVSQKFFGLVPYFCPTPIARALKVVEPVFESVPVARQLACGTNLILYKKP